MKIVGGGNDPYHLDMTKFAEKGNERVTKLSTCICSVNCNMLTSGMSVLLIATFSGIRNIFILFNVHEMGGSLSKINVSLDI